MLAVIVIWVQGNLLRHHSEQEDDDYEDDFFTARENISTELTTRSILHYVIYLYFLH